MTLSYVPIFIVDVAGSLMLIVLGLLCLRLAIRIRNHDMENAVWTYLVWVCWGFMIFSVSRSTGHIVKQMLILEGYRNVWLEFQPYSGAVNTLALLLVGSISLFFPQIWGIYKQISRDRSALQAAHEELMSLNQNLERRVAQRTQALAEESEQRMVLEKHMAQAEKLAAIGELSAGVAHEINNPLGIILGYSQLLIRGETEDSDRKEDLKTIEKHVKHCQRIVADLLSFSRNAGTEKQPGSIHEILDDVLDFIGKHTDSKSIGVVKDYDPNLPPVIMDREKIKQVFINLVMNARYAMESEGILTLTTRFTPEDRKAVIRVTDNGSGIAESDITRIFEPFFTTKPTGQGTGLGLSVTYGIIREHGGDIYAESTVGEGSTFSILLPVQ